MDAAAFRRAQGIKALGHIEQRVDVRHADQAEADPLARDRVEAVVVAMQLHRLITQQVSQLPAEVGLFAGGIIGAGRFHRDGEDRGAAAYLLDRGQPNDAAFHEDPMVG